jgi:phosphatidylglycerol:prolipoprotein diacylglycerol transferase
MIILNLNPALFKIGTIQVTYYALVYLIGFLAALFVLLNAIKKKELNMTESQAYDFIICLIVGIIIGARLFHIFFWNFSYFLSDPIKIFKIWEGGFSFHGGLLGAVIASLFYAKKKKINLGKLTDILTLPAVFMLALGRIANFINQEIVGKITDVSWCVLFDTASGCRHPVQLYAAAGRFALFFFLLYVKKSLKKFKPGFLFWLFIFLIGFGRFFLDFLREGTAYLGLQLGQWFSLVMIIISLVVLIKNYREEIKRVI